MSNDNTRARAVLADGHYTEGDIGDELAKELFNHFINSKDPNKYIPVIFSVGATSSTGDALGPFVGWFLKRNGYRGLSLGDLENPVHATNIKTKINDAWMLAMRQNKHPYIIAIDAAVGRPGRITLNTGPLRPGAGMGKSLPNVGEVHIMGGTAHFPFMIWFTGLDQTVGMAEIIAKSIMKFHDMYEDLKLQKESV